MSTRPYATAFDLTQTVQVTYNGRPCDLMSVSIEPDAYGGPDAPINMHIRVTLPKGWDQGPQPRTLLDPAPPNAGSKW